MRIQIGCCLLMVGALLVGCGDDPVDPTPDTEVDVADAADAVDDTGEDVAADAELDTVDDTIDDITDELVIGDPCERQRDCQGEGVCIDAFCVQVNACSSSSWVTRCLEPINALVPGLGDDAACIDEQCTLPCINDTDCYDGEICTDYGICRVFDHEVTGINPGGDARAPLQAGVGESLLGFPVGVPTGGYGERAATNDGRYAESLRGTIGQMHGLYARAVVLDNGEREIMMIRLPVVFSTAAIHEAVAWHLQERTGEDWRESLVISATHTHSGPARFWHIPGVGALALGSFGTGEFSQEIWNWLVESIIEAADDALDNMQPAEFGWDIVEEFDNEDSVGRDRWDETPPFDDNRTLVMRVNDTDGIPLAVLFSFSAHGTDNSGDYLSGDVISGAEFGLSERLSVEYGTYVPAMFFNSNSGSMAPASGSVGHRYPHSTERMGWIFTEKVWDTIEGLEMNTDLEMDMSTLRFPLRYELLGYEPNEWSGVAQMPIGGEYTYGAITCGARRDFGDEDYATYAPVGNLNCVALHFLIFNRPPTIFVRSQISALELGGLTILTAPGELTQEVSWQILRTLRDEHGVEPADSWTMGYAQDHLLYLLPSNLRGEGPSYPGSTAADDLDTLPDFAHSYLQGGYESTLSPWGPRLGDFLVERALEVYTMLDDEDFEGSLPTALPQVYIQREYDPFPVDVTNVADIAIIEDVPATLTRFDSLEIAWVGGDPGAEMPQTPLVTLEWNNGGTWETAQLPNHRSYDNRSNHFMTRLRENAGNWEWVARWEELQQFPLGTYRFQVDGHYMSDAGREAYSLTSGEFEVTPFTDINVEATVAGNVVTATAWYPPAEQMQYFGDIDFADPGSVAGNFRMRHPLVGTGTRVPLIEGSDLEVANIAVTIVAGGDFEPIDIAVSGADTLSSTITFTIPDEVPAGAATLQIDITDMHGNTATYSESITAP